MLFLICSVSFDFFTPYQSSLLLKTHELIAFISYMLYISLLYHTYLKFCLTQKLLKNNPKSS